MPKPKAQKRRTTVKKPPPALACNRVVEYAIRDRSIPYSGHSHLYRDDKEVGPVPCLAICRDDEQGDFVLIHCSRKWTDLGFAGGYKTISEAKRRAERIYPGISRAWKKTGVTKQQCVRYLDSFGLLRCISCNKPWYKMDKLVEIGRDKKEKIALCGKCVTEFYQFMNT